MAEEEIKGKGFTVQDRRRFTDSGDAKADTAETVASAASQPPPSATATTATDPHRDDPLPEINFSTFVVSLSTQALMHLGEIPNPANGNLEQDIPVAKQMIDLVAMLKDKTKGNLTHNEDKLIEDILFDLRMRYVERVKQK
ncbi:MAG: DUF1844 domain-containing protein [Deltaproteobacteria bacterium]|nr:DUF1844 domain-containing protein [Deltaproteobacteria bacterium]